MGNCNNLGENSVYTLKKRDKECPNNYQPDFRRGEEIKKFNGYWFSGDKNLGESGKTRHFQVAAAASASYLKENSATAAVTYQVRDGRYFQKCRWQKSRGGNWRCIPRRKRG